MEQCQHQKPPPTEYDADSLLCLIQTLSELLCNPAHDQASALANTSVALWPPNPREFDIAVRTCTCRAVFGT